MDAINILITNVSYQAATSLIKMLRTSRKYQCKIYGCDMLPKGLSSGSVLIDHFECINGNSLEKDYINSILNICSKYKIDLTISAEETDLILFKKYNIPCSYPDNIVSSELINLFNDKHRSNLSMKNMGLTIPKTIMNNKDFQRSLNNKFIQRKRVSCSSRGIKYFTRSEINETYTFYSSDYITQEYIDGDMYNIDVLCDGFGKPKLIIPRISLSEKDGTTFKCIFEENQQLIEICKKIYTKYKIPGFSNVQFIVKNNVPYFIELNPRAAATVIASSLVSTNWMDLYIDNYVAKIPIPSYEELMHCVKWNTIISRYYQETLWRNDYERKDFTFNREF